MCAHVICELTDESGVAAIGDEHDTSHVDIDEERDVVIAANCSGFVDADPAQRGEIHACNDHIDVVEDGAP